MGHYYHFKGRLVHSIRHRIKVIYLKRPKRECTGKTGTITIQNQKLDRKKLVFSHPVNDAGRVQMFDAAQHLIEQVGHPLVVQLHLNHLAQVGVHQLHHKITEQEGEKKVTELLWRKVHKLRLKWLIIA